MPTLNGRGDIETSHQVPVTRGVQPLKLKRYIPFCAKLITEYRYSLCSSAIDCVGEIRCYNQIHTQKKRVEMRLLFYFQDLVSLRTCRFNSCHPHFMIKPLQQIVAVAAFLLFWGEW